MKDTRSLKDMYDLTPEKLEILRWRDAKRKQLRELYLKDAGHPTKSLLFDTGIYRYTAAKATPELFFQPRAIDYITKVGFIGGLIVLTAYCIKKSKDAQEHKYRTGQVSYADRWTKFL